MTITAKLSRWLRNPLKAYHDRSNYFAHVDLEEQTFKQGLSGWQTLNGYNRADGPQYQPEAPNPLEAFFDARKEGRTIHKWRHYFPAYHRHLEKFVGSDAHILEIGLDKGGSLDMWRDYFGPRVKLYGMDIDPKTKSYEAEGTKVFIGDQSDRKFWSEFRREVPMLDAVIEDGGHTPLQQMVSIEELLPMIRPGGVYLCEDIHGDDNLFAQYIGRLSQLMHAFQGRHFEPGPDGVAIESVNSPFQTFVQSLHVYPFIVVLERNLHPATKFISVKHGSI